MKYFTVVMDRAKCVLEVEKYATPAREQLAAFASWRRWMVAHNHCLGDESVGQRAVILNPGTADAVIKPVGPLVTVITHFAGVDDAGPWRTTVTRHDVPSGQGRTVWTSHDTLSAAEDKQHAAVSDAQVYAAAYDARLEEALR